MQGMQWVKAYVIDLVQNYSNYYKNKSQPLLTAFQLCCAACNANMKSWPLWSLRADVEFRILESQWVVVCMNANEGAEVLLWWAVCVRCA
jgi:hypothetical protein